jgi:hypothetical protein
MSSARLPWFVFVFVAAVSAGCPRTIQSTPDAGPGPDDGFIACATVEDCPNPNPERTRCDGVCLTLCSADAECPLDAFCDTNGTCARGCRDSTTCPDGQVCVNGNCGQATSECATKCDCDPGKICEEGACQDPPVQCSGGDDCPRGPADRCEAFSCNGFTRQCVDPDPEPCTVAADCSGRPGCTGGAICACTSSGACVPDVACTAQDEATTCGSGNFCDGNGRCQALPACTQTSDCTASGLSCGPAGFCERPRACTATTDCQAPPNTFCDTNTGFCALPTCVNGGITCQNGLECSQGSGRCVQPGTGTTCTANANCSEDEYCDFPDQLCRLGCRDNLDCPSGQNCDGTHACVGSGDGGGGQFGDSCADDSGCQSPLICGRITGTCTDSCSPFDDSCPTCTAVHGTCTCFLIACGPG